MATIVAEFGDCGLKQRLSPKTATVAEFGDCHRKRRQIVAEYGDYNGQCGQDLILRSLIVT